jgi:preprotein translocase subunit SecE
MATKAALANGDERPASNKPTPVKPSSAKRQAAHAEPNGIDKAVGQWKDFTRFLSDVRGEMRKVVTPSRKEVQSTTTVVILAVFLFGVFFFVADAVFDFGLHQLLSRLGGLQQ